MTTRRTRVLGLAFFAGCLIGAGTYEAAYANSYTADADCSGMSFSMPASELGTQVRTFLNGRQVRVQDVTVDKAAVSITLASPDATVQQSWRVEIDSRWNDDHVWAETVPACVAPTTIATTTTVAPTTTVAVTTPPVPSTTVVQPPRATTTTTTPIVPPVFELPETGTTDFTVPMLVTGICCVSMGVFAMLVRRKGRAS